MLLVTNDDGLAILGLPILAKHGEASYIQVTTDAADAEVMDGTVDFIVHDGVAGEAGSGWTNYFVTRPCYLALRRAVVDTQTPYVGVIAMMEPDRALAIRDVEAALGHEVVAEVNTNPVAARMIDAGLFTSRYQGHFYEVHALALSHLAGAKVN